MFEKSQLVGIVESAFAPLRCVAKLKDYEHAFGFAVYLPDGSRIRYEEKNAALLQNENLLSSAISAVRVKIEAQGIVLAKWSLPTAE
jgi:hypothetical protein